jgi:hypothetical protein
MRVELTEDNVAVDSLPSVLRDMAGIIGLQATLKIVKHYGGVRLYVPRSMSPEHILSRIIGFEAAIKLAGEFGGMDHFDIPRAVAAIRATRNAEMSEKFRKGKTLRELAIEYAMTERGVMKALDASGTSHDDRQSPLF